jgi:haloalkane dehalogenase
MRTTKLRLALVICAALIGCSNGGAEAQTSPVACDSEPLIMTTQAGVDFVRTPDSCFDSLPGFPYEAKYVEIDGLRQGYVDEGPAGADPILLLHGQPSWSYLYRKMIPVLVDAGHRVIAMDHVGMGRSDKPIDIEYYSYLGHIDRLEKFIGALNLDHITLFCQDWGSMIGLHVAGKHSEWFDRIVVGDGTLAVIPAWITPFPPVENPDEINTEIVSPFADIPPQQLPFYDEDCNLLSPGNQSLGFPNRMRYAMTGASFHPAEVLEALTYYDLPSDEEDAYDAPFPSRIYMAGARVFPSLVNDIPGVNDDAWASLTRYEKPFLTIWATNDPLSPGPCEVQDHLTDNIPGAEGQHHTRLPEASHFLQDDQGAEIARQLVEFIAAQCIDIDGDGYGYPATHDCEHPELDCEGENPDANHRVRGDDAACQIAEAHAHRPQKVDCPKNGDRSGHHDHPYRVRARPADLHC